VEEGGANRTPQAVLALISATRPKGSAAHKGSEPSANEAMSKIKIIAAANSTNLQNICFKTFLLILIILPHVFHNNFLLCHKHSIIQQNVVVKAFYTTIFRNFLKMLFT